MRQPTFRRSRRRTRRQRFLRTAVLLVAGIASASLLVSVLGGDGEPGPGDLPTPVVAFEPTFAGEGDKDPDAGLVSDEGDAIVAMLDDWYQRAFVDTEAFGDGTFPAVKDRFVPEAQDAFARDVDALTIGAARTEVARVEPRTATADITVFFERGTKARYATAVIRFTARGIMKDRAQPVLRIDQRVTLVLRKRSGDWFVSTFYEAQNKQRQVAPSPSPEAA